MDPIRRLTAIALPILTVMALGTSATGPAAGAASGTSCTFEADFVASPGLSAQGSSGTVETVKDGPGVCNGPVNGKQPSGPGTYSFTGRYGTKDPDSWQTGA